MPINENRFSGSSVGFAISMENCHDEINNSERTETDDLTVIIPEVTTGRHA
jgi:hypothetical protein